METQKEIKLLITIEEANLILDALGNQPFSKVYQLIAKIQSQAAAQLNESEASVEPKENTPK